MKSKEESIIQIIEEIGNEQISLEELDIDILLKTQHLTLMIILFSNKKLNLVIFNDINEPRRH